MSLTCKFCKKIFNTKSNLYRHQKTTKSCLVIQEKENYTNISIITYDCNICEKKFTSKQILNSHMTSCPVLPLKIKYDKIIESKDNLIKSLQSENCNELKDLKEQNRDLIKMNDYLSMQSSQHYVKELQDKLHEIALTAIEIKNEKISHMVKKYVKKQPRVQYGNTVIYILTTPSLKKDSRYILGKAKNLKNRVAFYTQPKRLNSRLTYMVF